MDETCIMNARLSDRDWCYSAAERIKWICDVLYFATGTRLALEDEQSINEQLRWTKDIIYEMMNCSQDGWGLFYKKYGRISEEKANFEYFLRCLFDLNTDVSDDAEQVVKEVEALRFSLAIECARNVSKELILKTVDALDLALDVHEREVVTTFAGPIYIENFEQPAECCVCVPDGAAQRSEGTEE